VEGVEIASQPSLMAVLGVLGAAEMVRIPQQQVQEPQIKATLAEQVKPHQAIGAAVVAEALALLV
jgi:hypothetical protein